MDREGSVKTIYGEDVATYMHPLGYCFVHICTYAGLGTRERDFFIQHMLIEPLNCVSTREFKTVRKFSFDTDFLKYQRPYF